MPTVLGAIVSPQDLCQLLKKKKKSKPCPVCRGFEQLRVASASGFSFFTLQAACIISGCNQPPCIYLISLL